MDVTKRNSLFDNPLFSDVVIKVKDRVIYAHKSVLYSRSEYFRAFVHGNFKDATEPVIDLQRDEVDAIEMMLRWIYDNTLDPIDINQLLRTYTVADKYLVPDLKLACEGWVSENNYGWRSAGPSAVLNSREDLQEFCQEVGTAFAFLTRSDRPDWEYLRESYAYLCQQWWFKGLKDTEEFRDLLREHAELGLAMQDVSEIDNRETQAFAWAGDP